VLSVSNIADLIFASLIAFISSSFVCGVIELQTTRFDRPVSPTYFAPAILTSAVAPSIENGPSVFCYKIYKFPKRLRPTAANIDNPWISSFLRYFRLLQKQFLSLIPVEIACLLIPQNLMLMIKYVPIMTVGSSPGCPPTLTPPTSKIFCFLLNLNMKSPLLMKIYIAVCVYKFVGLLWV
jgi:hypothetical protein